MILGTARKVIITSILMFFMLIPLSAAEITGISSPESTTVHSPFALDIVVSKSPAQKVIPDESIEWYKALKVNSISETVGDTTVTVTYSLAAYAPPLCSIPSFKLFVVPTDSSDTTGTDTLESEAMAIKVISQFVNDSNPSVSAGLGDPMKAGKFPVEQVYKLLGIIIVSVIALLLIIALIRHIIMKRQNRTFWGEPAVPAIPPYEEAVAALTAFVKHDYFESGELKNATFELSEILKRYVGRRFECAVQESTSSEFRSWIAVSPLNREQCNMLERFISETEPVKFANITPASSVVTAIFDDIKAFVEETRPVTEEKEETK